MHREIKIKQFPIVTTHWWPKTRNEWCSGLKTNQSRRSWVRNNLWRVNHPLHLHLEVYFDQPKNLQWKSSCSIWRSFWIKRVWWIYGQQKKCVLPLSPLSFPASSSHNRCLNSHIISDTPKFTHGHMTSHMNIYMAPISGLCEKTNSIYIVFYLLYTTMSNIVCVCVCEVKS